MGEEHIEALRKECLKSRKIINKKDFGTGSGEAENVTYPVEIRKIAADSLTSRRNARRLNRMVRFMKAQKILEIGTSLGITSAYLAMANPGARIITLEGCPELSNIARKNFRRLGLDNVDLIEGRFENTLPKALEQLGTVDFVYIDGNHRKEAMLDYFSKCLAFSNNNTVMIFDDIHMTDEMENGWDAMVKNEKIRVSLDLFFSGWIFFRKESSREHFKLRYF